MAAGSRLRVVLDALDGTPLFDIDVLFQLGTVEDQRQTVGVENNDANCSHEQGRSTEIGLWVSGEGREDRERETKRDEKKRP